MRFIVVCNREPIGSVDLMVSALTAGRLAALPAYARIEARVRAASAAVLEFGVYGPRPSVLSDAKRQQARAALRSGAALQVDLVPHGSTIPTDTTFVNLVEAPGDGHIVVIAAFVIESAGRAAGLPQPIPLGGVRHA